ncbi:MAG: dsDNA nuclease domain-containing protein, partial [Nitrosotalea sp.]
MGEIEDLAKIPATGDEVQRRYRYQNLYTALLAIKMYKKEIPYEKLYCELAEDILAARSDKKLVAIQIKTTENDPFSYSGEPVIKSLGRFIELHKNFPDVFAEFIFVSNTGFKKDRNLEDVLSNVKNNKFDENILQFINKLSTKFGVETDIVIEVLKKTSLQKGPGIDDIESKIIHEHLSKVDHCSSLTHSKLSSILNIFVLSIYKKSSKEIPNSLKDYVSFVRDGKLKQQQIEIESKIITIEMVEQITKSENPLYLVSADGSSLRLKEGSIDLMEQKMAAGGIDVMEINSMKDLSLSAQNHFIEEYHKRNGESEEIKKEMDHLQTLLANQAAEAKTETKNNDKLYGDGMLNNIEKRIDGIAKMRPQDVFFIKYG